MTRRQTFEFPSQVSPLLCSTQVKCGKRRGVTLYMRHAISMPHTNLMFQLGQSYREDWPVITAVFVCVPAHGVVC